MASKKIAVEVSKGDTFGRWVVIGRGPDKLVGQKSYKVRSFRCVCACGTERDVLWSGLQSGKSQSCGCLNRERSSQVHTVHGAAAGYAATPEYGAWKAIIDRCENPKNKRFADYGGRGIKMAPEWRKDFVLFLSHVGPRPAPGYSIDRQNNDADYAPGNVRWATSSQQMVNRRNTQFVKVGAQVRPLADIAKEFGIPANTLRHRLRAGWSLSEATSVPVRHKSPNGSGPNYWRYR